MNNNLYDVAYVTSSRADYGIVRRYLKLLNDDQSIHLEVIATGSMLSDSYGKPVNLVRNDGFQISAELPIPLDDSSNARVLRSMAVALDSFGNLFETKKPDLLIVLGDRYEMLPVATAAAMQRIPMLHLHGGEATYGNYDEFIRHAITKMSLFHFTATEEYRNRVIQLGEDPSRVWNLGSLGAENCLIGEADDVPEAISSLPFKQYGVVLFHPETLTAESPANQVREVLGAIDAYLTFKWVFIGVNADTGAGDIQFEIDKYIDTHDNATYFKNLEPGAYHHLLKNALCLVGNSSSGLIEAPSLGVRTVNIGHRQDGRVRGDSVIDVPCERDAIRNGVASAIALAGTVPRANPYYQPNTAQSYYEKTIEILSHLSNKQVAKEFFDLPVGQFLTET